MTGNPAGDDAPSSARETAGQPDSSMLSEGTFADPAGFESTLKTALLSSNSPNLQSYDGEAGSPVIIADQQFRPATATDDTNQAGANRVVLTAKMDGRVVRERMEHGPDVVVAYDDQGRAHRFLDEKITNLPVDFSSIPDWRVKQMNETAYKLLEQYMIGANPIGGPDGHISFNDIASIMKDISQMPNFTEVEKARLWSEVRNVMQERGVPILDADEKPEMIDSWKGRRDPWHALITMNDGYHANRLINLTPAQASKAIQDHENGAEAQNRGWWGALKWHAANTVLGTNTGDINASEGQLAALRAYRTSGTFAAYAAEWERQFVRPDRDQYGFPR